MGLWKTKDERTLALAALEESFMKPLHEAGLLRRADAQVAVAMLRAHLEKDGEGTAAYLHRVVELLSERHDIIYPNHRQEPDSNDQSNP